jgi:hypothetical protein
MTTIPTPIIDKNGKSTTVHKKVETASTSRVGSAPISAPATHNIDALALERDQADNLLEDVGENIVVSNHGAFPNRRPTVSLTDMSDGDVARGNCWSIVNELIEVAGTDYFGDYVDELNMHTKDGLSHTGLFVKKGDKEYVVDYTARQFGQHLDFPVVAPVEEWKLLIEKSYGQPFEYTPASDEDDDEDSYEWYDED